MEPLKLLKREDAQDTSGRCQAQKSNSKNRTG